MVVQNIYGVPPPPPEEHHEAIEYIQPIVQGIQKQSYELEGLAQGNTSLTRFNSAVMAKLAQITVAMKAMQAQMNTLASAKINQTRPNRKHYCWSCSSNYTHGSKTCLLKK